MRGLWGIRVDTQVHDVDVTKKCTRTYYLTRFNQPFYVPLHLDAAPPRHTHTYSRPDRHMEGPQADPVIRGCDTHMPLQLPFLSSSFACITRCLAFVSPGLAADVRTYFLGSRFFVIFLFVCMAGLLASLL